MNPIRSNFQMPNGASLVPDYSNANALAMGIAKQIKTEKVQQAEAEEAQTIATNLSNLTQKELLENPESRAQLLQLYNLDKEMGAGVLEILKTGDAYAKNELAEVNAEAERINTNMINLAGTKGEDVNAAKNFLRETIIEKNSNGIETPKLTALLGMPNDQFLGQLRTNQAMIGTVSALAPVEPIEINGQLVNPVTYEVVGDYRDPEEPKERETITQNGVAYYIDNQQPVLPNVAPKLSKAEEDALDNQTAWGAFQQAGQAMMSALDDVTGFGGFTDGSGYIEGNMPATSAEQQTADGAIAAMAPILKQIFRGAGEGTFTDQDQALLMGMIPLRSDEPTARNNKWNNIQRIVAAKLGGSYEPPVEDDMSGLPDSITEDDITTTMKKRGMTREEVINKLREKY